MASCGVPLSSGLWKKRENENKKELEEGHKCDNSCRLYNLRCFSGRYGGGGKSQICVTFRVRVQGNSFSLRISSEWKRICKLDGWADERMSGWVAGSTDRGTQSANKQISGAYGCGWIVHPQTISLPGTFLGFWLPRATIRLSFARLLETNFKFRRTKSETRRWCWIHYCHGCSVILREEMRECLTFRMWQMLCRIYYSSW